MGSYFCDYGCFQEAIEWYQLADAHLARVQTVTYDGLPPRSVQHRGIANAGLRIFPEAESVLERASEMLDATARYPEGLANDALWKARIKLQQKASDLDECADLLRGIYRLREKDLVSAWTYGEALRTDADLRLLRGRKTDSFDLTREGTRVFREAGIVPTAVLPCQSASIFTERYPREVYVLPRNPTWLRDFREQADKVHKSLQLG